MRKHDSYSVQNGFGDYVMLSFMNYNNPKDDDDMTVESFTLDWTTDLQDLSAKLKDFASKIDEMLDRDDWDTINVSED